VFVTRKVDVSVTTPGLHLGYKLLENVRQGITRSELSAALAARLRTQLREKLARTSLQPGRTRRTDTGDFPRPRTNPFLVPGTRFDTV